MSSVFQKLNSIDNRVKDSVFGYIRVKEKQLSLDNIPALISYITLNYYYHNEYFAKHGKQVKLSNNNMTVTKQEIIEDREEYENTTYGNTWIDSTIPQIARWTLRFDIEISSAGLTVLLLSNDNRLDEECCKADDEPYYGFDSSGTLFYDVDDADCSANEGDTDIYLNPGQFSIILNTRNKTICLEKDDSSEVIWIFKNIETGKSIKQ